MCPRNQSRTIWRRLNIERVLHLARWMIWRHVQNFEVIPVRLNLWPLYQRESQSLKDTVDFFKDLLGRVHVATAGSQLAGLRQVNSTEALVSIALQCQCPNFNRLCEL